MLNNGLKYNYESLLLLTQSFTAIVDTLRRSPELDPDDTLTIYAKPNQSDTWTVASPAVLAHQNLDGTHPAPVIEAGYRYFLEVMVAQEVFEDWQAHSHSAGIDAIGVARMAEVFIYYAQNDVLPLS